MAQLFAWEAHDKGVDVHLLAEPTKLEILQKEYDKKKEQFKSQVRKTDVFCWSSSIVAESLNIYFTLKHLGAAI